MLRVLAVALVVSTPLTLVAQNPQSVFTLKSVGPNVWAAIDSTQRSCLRWRRF